MTKAIFALTATGAALARKLEALLPEATAVIPEKHVQETDTTTFKSGELSQAIEQAFQEYEALIFIMATGIVVRKIAPLLTDKRYDPAVVVLDERGQFVISLVSGHVGGANDLTRKLSTMLQATAVITTATDVQEVAALDVLAQQVGGTYSDFKVKTKQFNGLLAAHEAVALYQEQPLVEDLRGLTVINELTPETLAKFSAVIVVSPLKLQLPETPASVQVVPKVYTLGMGAKKNQPFTVIKEQFLLFCEEQQISPYAIREIVSIDLKKHEAGIIALAEWLAVPFITYSVEELQTVDGQFPQSAFVKKITGVGSVAQASAAYHQKGAVSSRYARAGVTFALGGKEE